MRIEILPFNELYLSYFHYNGVENIYANDGEAVGVAKELARRGDAWMAVLDDIPIVIGGIFPIKEFTGQAWLFFQKEARAYKKAIFRALQTHIEAIARNRGYRVIEIACLKESFEANNLAEHLGFTPGKEFILYHKAIGE